MKAQFFKKARELSRIAERAEHGRGQSAGAIA